MKLVERVRLTMLRERLRPADGRILLACSGGLDSTAMLDILHRLAEPLELQLIVATFDHRWRQMPIDLELVQEQSRERGLECIVGQAGKADKSETGARRQRHAFLRRAADEAGCTRIAIAHQLDDRVETTFMNLLRGAGTTGLGAMPPLDEPIIRPLAEVTKVEVCAYLDEHKLRYFFDPENIQMRHYRNVVRHRLLPGLEKRFRGIYEALTTTTRLCALERGVLRDLVAERFAARRLVPGADSFLYGLGAVVLDLAGWHEQPRGLQYLLWRAAIEALAGDLTDIGLADIERLEALAERPAGAGPAQLGSSAGTVLVGIHAGTAVLLLESLAPPPWGPVVLEPGANRIDAAGLTIHLGGGGRPAWQVEIAADRLLNLTARSRRDGDRLRPAGRGGSRKIGDLMQELGIPRLVRERVPIVCDGERPVWLPGCAPEEEYARAANKTVTLGIELHEVPADER